MNLPIVQRIINSLEKAVTGFSPAELLFGSALTLNKNLVPKADQEAREIIDEPINEWLATRAEQQMRLLALARKAQQKHDQAHTDDATPGVTRYAVGDWVLKDYPPTMGGANGRPNKLYTNSKGPFKIIKVISDQEYLVHDAHNRPLEPVSVHLLRPYIFDSTRTDPTKEGYRDNESWEVEKIVGHTSNGKNPRHWTFKVKWKDYDSSQNTKEPWCNLLHNEFLHEYLNKLKLGSYIPKSNLVLDTEADSKT